MPSKKFFSNYKEKQLTITLKDNLVSKKFSVIPTIATSWRAHYTYQVNLAILAYQVKKKKKKNKNFKSTLIHIKYDRK